MGWTDFYVICERIKWNPSYTVYWLSVVPHFAQKTGRVIGELRPWLHLICVETRYNGVLRVFLNILYMHLNDMSSHILLQNRAMTGLPCPW
jgi:hypothetical protein